MTEENIEEDHQKFEALKREALNAIQVIFAESDWGSVEGGILTEAVICMVWMEPNGHNECSVFPATTHWWSTYGLLKDALDKHTDAREDD
jgi:hypothetical protein